MQLGTQLDQLRAARNADQQSAQQQVAALEKQRSELEKQLNSRPATAPAPAPTLFSFVLMPGLTRDADVTKPLLIPAGAGDVRFELNVRKKGPFKNYVASIETLDGQQVWSGNLATPQLTVPARVLPAGDYVVELKGTPVSGEPEDAGEFYFSVVRK